MFERMKRLAGQREEGQSLVLLAFALIVVLGATAMSVDVGRAYWAKTQVQAAVDAAALAGAAGLPNTTTAGANADTYWDLNNNFLQAQGSNVTLTKSYNLATTKEITVTGSADIDTWFARVLGIDSWHVSASATAEFQQVDAMLVLDRSGSMCYDSHTTDFTGLVRLSDGDTNTGNGNTNMPTTKVVNGNTVNLVAGTDTTTVKVAKNNSASSSALSDLVWVGQRFQWTNLPSGSAEWMEITAISDANMTLTLRRGVYNPNTATSGTTTIRANVPGNSQWINGATCPQSGKGPFLPWAYIKTGGTVFVNNMNSAYDQIGYVDFGSQATLNQDFTTNFTGLKTTITSTWDPGIISASNLNGDDEEHYTNIAHGIWYGVNRHLVSPNKRAGVSKVIVLLSDGVPNKYCQASGGSASTQSTSCNDTQNTSTATQWSKDAADYAKANNIIIYTISYGAGADTALMADIAARTGGKHYITPNEATLNVAFQEIAKSTHVKLTN